MTNNDNNIFEGIGNEVLWSVSGVLGITLGSIFMYHRFQTPRMPAVEPNTPAMDASLRQQIHNPTGEGEDSTAPERPHFASEQCPVCLTEFRYPVETNCGHMFCAQCLISYWRHGNWLGAIRCPVCRQSVAVLLQCFREASDTDDLQERNRMLYDINDYNRHFSIEPRPWLEYLWDLPTLLRHAGSEFFSVGGLMYMFRLRIILCFVAALMYLISPLDMIPEAVFGLLGLIDDMFVVFLLAIYVTVIYRRFLATRWQNQ